MNECRCGGYLMPEWDTCRFCGATVVDGEAVSGPALPPPPPPGAVPVASLPAPTGTGGSAAPAAGPGADPAGSRAIKVLGIAFGGMALLAVVCIVAITLLGTESRTEFVEVGTQLATPTADRELTNDAFCLSDGSAGIPGAPAYDPAATDREVHIDDDWGAELHPLATSYTDPVSVIVCVRQTEVSVNGKRCDDYEGRYSFQSKVAPYEYTAHDASTGEIIGSIDVPAPEGHCPPIIFADQAGGGIVTGEPSPDRAQLTMFVHDIVNPSG